MTTDISGAIARERAFQRAKYGDTKHDLSLWVLIMERELAEVKDAIIKKTYDEARCELLQVVAVGHAALEQHGVAERIDEGAVVWAVRQHGTLNPQWFAGFDASGFRRWTDAKADAERMTYSRAAETVTRFDNGWYHFACVNVGVASE